MGASQTQTILMVDNTAWSFYNYRRGVIEAIIRKGYKVILAAPYDNNVGKLQQLGATFIHLPMQQNSTNPIADALLLYRFWRLMKSQPIALYLGYTIKPNIYGNLVAKWLGIPTFSNIAGLGSAFVTAGWLTRLTSCLYRYAMTHTRYVFFQNDDDKAVFLHKKIIRPQQAVRIPGSGINVSRFQYQPLPQRRNFRFTLLSRLIDNKGIVEFVAAARQLAPKLQGVEFVLYGALQPRHTMAISAQQLADWQRQGSIHYAGVTDDVATVVAQSDCIVLPSYYREGVPRVLIEAAAIGRPIITTDWVGCREVVDDGINGLLCRPKDVTDLAAKMQQMVNYNHSTHQQMGLAGRKKAVQIFDENIIIRRYLAKVVETIGVARD